MKKIAFILILFAAPRLHGSGFDDTILWLYDIPGAFSISVNSDPRGICENGLRAAFLYANPYGISELDWNHGFVKRGFEGWGVFGRFDSFGMKSYFRRNAYYLGGAISLPDSLALSVHGVYQTERYGDMGDYSRIELNSALSFHKAEIEAVAGLAGIKIDEDYRSPANGNLRPWGALTYRFKDGLSAFGSIKRFDNGQIRWLFGQGVRLSGGLDLAFGVINRPDVIFGHIVFVYKSFRLDLSYYSISRLNDTVVYGFAYGG
jgi:hypothetical protein